MFKGVEFEANEYWSNQPIISSVDEAPPREEVELVAAERIRLR